MLRDAKNARDRPSRYGAEVRTKREGQALALRFGDTQKMRGTGPRTTVLRDAKNARDRPSRYGPGDTQKKNARDRPARYGSEICKKTRA